VKALRPWQGLELRYRLVVAFFALVFIVVAAMGALAKGLIEGYLVRAQRQSLLRQARIIEEVARAYPRGRWDPATRRFVRLASRLVDADVTVVAPDGTLLGGSPRSDEALPVVPSGLVRYAVESGSAASARVEARDGTPVLAVVVPVGGPGSAPEAALVLSRPLKAVTSASADLAALLIRVGVLGLLLSLALGFAIARSISRPLEELVRVAEEFKRGNLEHRVRSHVGPDFSRLADALNGMADRIASLLERRQRFAADISHELRTPVTSIRGFVRALRDGVVPDKDVPRYLRIIDGETTRLARLIDDLLQLSRLEAGRLDLRRTEIDPGELLEEAGERFREQAESWGVRLSVEHDEGLPAVKADPERIDQILDNLVVNALRHVERGGNVTLEGRLREGSVELLVRDDGPGIPPEDLPFVFERHFRGRESTGMGGLGLGLAIARELARAHGGDVRAENHPAGGSVFTVVLPIPRGGTPVTPTPQS